MKVNKIMDKHAAVATVPVATVKEEAAPPVDVAGPTTNHAIVFPVSDRFKHMLNLIARDNKELYNRIVGMD